MQFSREIYKICKAKKEKFQSDPESQEATGKVSTVQLYSNGLTKGNQGAISEIPVRGEIHLIDANDIVYIKPYLEMEADYNVF